MLYNHRMKSILLLVNMTLSTTIEIITDWTFHASKTNNKRATQGYNEEHRHNNNRHRYGGIGQI